MSLGCSPETAQVWTADVLNLRHRHPILWHATLDCDIPVWVARDITRAALQLNFTQAREFEQVYLSTMLNQMFSGLSTEAPFGGGQAEETWRGMLVDKYADTISKAGGVGIADAVYRDLLKVQEGSRA